MPFRTALSGLNGASTDLRVIGNNIANASTVGFKKSRTEFADIYAYAGVGAVANPIGSGVRVASINQQFTQGNIEFTDNNLDLSVSGSGFFMLSDNGESLYTRAGMFGADRDGYIVNSQDQRLQGYLADASGNVTGAIGDLWLDTSDIAPQETTSIAPGINLDASASIPVQPFSTSAVTLAGTSLDETAGTYTTPNFSVFDSYGNEYTNASIQFTYTGVSPVWDAELLIGGASTVPPTTATNINIGTDTFNFSWDPDIGGPQQPISIDVGTAGIASLAGGANDLTASGDGRVQLAFDANDASTYNNSTSLTIYDSLGDSHLASMFYRKTGVPNVWETYLSVDGNLIPGAQPNGSDLMTFGSAGELQSINGTLIPPSSLAYASYDPLNGSSPINLTMDFSSFTQYGGGFNVTSLSQDGYATGRLSGVDVDDSGVLLARFTNGQTSVLGQVALANFSNPQGLGQVGDTNWTETYSSGSPLVGQPGSSSLGLVQSGALEGSNVDLTEQLVNMITAQRNFQANAQVISTADQITQAIINIR